MKSFFLNSLVLLLLSFIPKFHIAQDITASELLAEPEFFHLGFYSNCDRISPESVQLVYKSGKVAQLKKKGAYKYYTNYYFDEAVSSLYIKTNTKNYSIPVSRAYLESSIVYVHRVQLHPSKVACEVIHEFRHCCAFYPVASAVTLYPTVHYQKNSKPSVFQNGNVDPFIANISTYMIMDDYRLNGLPFGD